jgi:5-formyltetrahydrofolate cyclo-ligase
VSISLDKSSIRKQKLEERLMMDAGTRREFSAQIASHLSSHLGSHPGTIAIYFPVRGEVDIASFLRPGVCLPVVVADMKELVFRVMEEGTALTKNAYGVMEPEEYTQTCEPDVIVVPLVAFDRRGYRIGYGGGHYDATIAALRARKKIVVIGAAFAMQEVEHIPEEAFDQKLDMVITEEEIIVPLT